MVEGCVGAGKSTVAKGLAACRGGKALLERFDHNPFLAAFYKDPVGNAVETEFAFLLLHFHQMKQHADEVSRKEVVADFHLGKDLLYADLNLSDGPSRRLFRDLHDLLASQTVAPDMMICLSASTELVVERIRERKREMELQIDPEYFATLNAAYERFFDGYSGRKLRISMDEWDFVQSPGLFERLSSLVDSELQPS